MSDRKQQCATGSSVFFIHAKVLKILTYSSTELFVKKETYFSLTLTRIQMYGHNIFLNFYKIFDRMLC